MKTPALSDWILIFCVFLMSCNHFRNQDSIRKSVGFKQWRDENLTQTKVFGYKRIFGEDGNIDSVFIQSAFLFDLISLAERYEIPLLDLKEKYIYNQDNQAYTIKPNTNGKVSFLRMRTMNIKEFEACIEQNYYIKHERMKCTILPKSESIQVDFEFEESLLGIKKKSRVQMFLYEATENP